MPSSNLVRYSGLVATLGVLFVVSALLIASITRGCIGDECAFRQIRDPSSAGDLPMLAPLLVVVGMAGLAIRARNAGLFGVWAGRARSSRSESRCQ